MANKRAHNKAARLLSACINSGQIFANALKGVESDIFLLSNFHFHPLAVYMCSNLSLSPTVPTVSILIEFPPYLSPFPQTHTAVNMY